MTHKVALLFDKSNNWIYKYFENYVFDLQNFEIFKFFDADKIYNFDFVFLLGYSEIIPINFITRNSLTLVVHESDLPKGKGFSPIKNKN